MKTIPANMLMVLAAFRYCLGRRTYIVGDCARWLIENADQLDADMRIKIAKEIDEREQRFGLGDTCDRQDWERVKAAMLRAPGAAMTNRVTHTHAARVYLAQSRHFTSRARGFSFILLGWAANARRRAMACQMQRSLF